MEITPVVAAYGSRHSIEVHIRRYFSRSKGAETMGIQQVWREGLVYVMRYS